MTGKYKVVKTSGRKCGMFSYNIWLDGQHVALYNIDYQGDTAGLVVSSDKIGSQPRSFNFSLLNDDEDASPLYLSEKATLELDCILSDLNNTKNS